MCGWLIISQTGLLSNVSGDRYSNLNLFCCSDCIVCRRCGVGNWLWRREAGRLRHRNSCTWFSINATNGETTKVKPVCNKAGSWKQIDLPPPVGTIIIVSFPANKLLTISPCGGRKSSYPHIFWKAARAWFNDVGSGWYFIWFIPKSEVSIIPDTTYTSMTITVARWLMKPGLFVDFSLLMAKFS